MPWEGAGRERVQPGNLAVRRGPQCADLTLGRRRRGKKKGRKKTLQAQEARLVSNREIIGRRSLL